MLRLMTSLLQIALIAGIAASASRAQDATGLDQLDRTGWPEMLTIGTADPDSPYSNYAGVVAPILEEALGIDVITEITGGPKQNAVLVELGDLDLGMVSMGPALEAWTGTSNLAPGLVHRNLRAVLSMYPSPFVFSVRSDLGIGRLEDLQTGMIVAYGPGGTTSDLYFPPMLDYLGLTVSRRNGGIFNLTEQLRDGLINAYAHAGQIPVPEWRDLDAAGWIRMFGFSEEQVATLVDAFPVSPYTIPEGVFVSQEGDLQTVAMWNILIASADLPETLVFGITETLFANREALSAQLRLLEETVPSAWSENNVLPFHSGAVLWYEGQGITIPERLRR